jgi:isopentenyldiphosphate isomerase
MAEFIDIYDENEKFVGAADRNVAHAFALWHRTVHCWIVLSDGRAVFQHRSTAKPDNPGRLYTTASGHLKAGESLKDAFAREVSEEIGITAGPPHFMYTGRYKADFKLSDGTEFRDRALCSIYFARYSGGLDTFRFNDGEVSGVAAVDMDEYLELAAGRRTEISGEEFDGQALRKIVLRPDDFLLVDQDTLYSKYGAVFEKIKAAMAGGA